MEETKLKQWAEFGRWSALIFGLTLLTVAIHDNMFLLIRIIMLLFGVFIIYVTFNY